MDIEKHKGFASTAERKGREYLDEVRAMVVVDQASAQQVVDVARAARATKDAAEARRTAITKPLLAAKREVDALFKPVSELFDEIEKVAKSHIHAYEDGLEARRLAAAEGGPIDRLHSLDKLDGAQVKTIKEVVIVDEDLLPREVLTYCPKKLAAYLAQHGRCPGVEVRTKTQVALVGGK